MEALAAIALVVLACIVAAVRFARRVARASASARPTIAFGRPSEVRSANPPQFTRRNYFFSAAERSFYEILRRLSPDHTVFAKVRLSDLVRVEASGRDFWQKFNSINGKHVDFLVCDENLAPVVAIELDDSSHDTPKGISRDQFVDSVLTSAALPIVRVRARRNYALEEIRQLLAPHLRLLSPNVGESTDAKFIPPRGWRPSA